MTILVTKLTFSYTITLMFLLTSFHVHVCTLSSMMTEKDHLVTWVTFEVKDNLLSGIERLSILSILLPIASS